jgi:N6-adenosine-specific RNA methylase IME4
MTDIIEAGGTCKPVDADAHEFCGWPAKIAARYRQAAESVIAIGDLIAAAKASLPHGSFEKMIATALPFGASTARRLMSIAADPRIRAHGHVLPASWRTQYELTKLDDAQFKQALADGTLCPEIERPQVAALLKAQRQAPAQAAYQERVAKGCRLEDLQAHADSGERYGSILADPNWNYETWSAKGRDRSPDQHYDTDPLATIKALPVRALAADDSCLYLWCMDWLLPGALEVIDAWGFTFIKVGFVWVKQNRSGEGLFMGMGKWSREGTELCLFATKGKPSRLNADVRQVIMAPIREHSRKPDETHERIERLTAGPYLELFARRLRPGWTCYGDEIPRADFAQATAAPAQPNPRPPLRLLPPPAEASSKATLKNGEVLTQRHDVPIKKDGGEISPPATPAVGGADNLDIPAFLRRGDPACPVKAATGFGGFKRETFSGRSS